MEALVAVPAVSLAKAVLNTVGWAVSATADKVVVVLGVQKDVQYIHDELTMMHAFVRVSSPAYPAAGGYSNHGRDGLQTAWAKQQRDLAVDIEGGLQDFMLLKGPSAKLPGVARRIVELRASVEELHKRNQRYHAFVGADRSPRHDQHGHDKSEPPLLDDRRHKAIFGRGDDKDALASRVSRDGATVVAVWGMAGVGKSSLARMLYDDSKLVGRFDRRAWVTVPHPLESSEEFGLLLQEQIGADRDKRCLVVVDNVSSQEEWGHVWHCLALNDAGGEVVVLVTTQQEDVARQCAPNVDVYELKPLAYKEARELLCKMVYKDANYKLP
ncbi:hypothetical protein ACQJBY_048116 [Aegilops geniculata]